MNDRMNDWQSKMMSYIVDITKAEILAGISCSSFISFVCGVEFDDAVFIAVRRREDDVDDTWSAFVVLT